MKKLIAIILVVCVFTGLSVFVVNHLALFKEGLRSGEMRGEGAAGREEVVVEEVAGGLDTPWSIVFTSPTRMLVTERPGRLRVIENGKLLPQPLHVFEEVSEKGEEGLMSLALRPDYQKNRELYVSLAYEKEGELWVKVVRFRDERDSLSGGVTIMDNIPAAPFHAGSRIAFGPDGKLYVTTGDATELTLAQRLDSLAGKILRLNADGSIPEDNPFRNSPVWSYGHRNPQGIAWHPETKGLYSTEHGPSVFDGPAGGDEVNFIMPGGNYGWPLVSHGERREGTLPPLLVFTPAEAPASGMFYSGRTFPSWKNNFFFGALKGEGIVRVVIDSGDDKVVPPYEKLAEVRYGRIREIVEGPDGFIYFSTSNRDGRGTPAPPDDRIFRIKPRGS